MRFCGLFRRGDSEVLGDGPRRATAGELDLEITRGLRGEDNRES